MPTAFLYRSLYTLSIGLSRLLQKLEFEYIVNENLKIGNYANVFSYLPANSYYFVFGSDLVKRHFVLGVFEVADNYIKIILYSISADAVSDSQLRGS